LTVACARPILCEEDHLPPQARRRPPHSTTSRSEGRLPTPPPLGRRDTTSAAVDTPRMVGTTMPPDASSAGLADADQALSALQPLQTPDDAEQLASALASAKAPAGSTFRRSTVSVLAQAPEDLLVAIVNDAACMSTLNTWLEDAHSACVQHQEGAETEAKNTAINDCISLMGALARLPITRKVRNPTPACATQLSKDFACCTSAHGGPVLWEGGCRHLGRRTALRWDASARMGCVTYTGPAFNPRVGCVRASLGHRAWHCGLGWWGVCFVAGAADGSACGINSSRRVWCQRLRGRGVDQWIPSCVAPANR